MGTQEITVLAYFRKYFPNHSFAQKRFEADLQSIPINSNCGYDCKKAIDAARKLLKSLDNAWGEEGSRWEHPRGRDYRKNVLDATVHTVAVFIVG